MTEVADKDGSLVELHRFVSFDRALSFVRLGWVPLPTLDGTHHGEWKVHLMWRCVCGVAEPDPRKVKVIRRALIRAHREQQYKYKQIAAAGTRAKI